MTQNALLKSTYALKPNSEIEGDTGPAFFVGNSCYAIHDELNHQGGMSNRAFIDSTQTTRTSFILVYNMITDSSGWAALGGEGFGEESFKSDLDVKVVVALVWVVKAVGKDLLVKMKA